VDGGCGGVVGKEKARHDFCIPPSVAEMSNERIPRIHWNMMDKLKSCRILICPVDKFSRLQTPHLFKCNRFVPCPHADSR